MTMCAPITPHHSIHFDVELSSGLLQGVTYLSSPHKNCRPEGEEIDLLVIHGISLPAGVFGGRAVFDLFLGQLDTTSHPSFAALSGLCVSAHVFISREGEVTQFVPFHERAWHAGASLYEGRSGCNDFSIGIELEGTDLIPYTDKQYDALVGITQALMRAYPGISKQRIVGHEQVAPGRKTDPGPSFDWNRYLANS